MFITEPRMAISSAPPTPGGAERPGAVDPTVLQEAHAALSDEFLDAAARVDGPGIEAVLDRALALGSFEAVAETWLMPTLDALGEAWAMGRVDVAGERTASHTVMRRLSQAFAGASGVAQGPRVIVGLPTGSHHELGALAFATVARRRGLAVVYLGADLPVASWVRAARAFRARAAVIVVPTAHDREAAAESALALRGGPEDILVAGGGRYSADLAPGVLTLPRSFIAAAALLDL